MAITALIAQDGHIVPRNKPMGRQVAGEQFIRSFLNHSESNQFDFICPSDTEINWIRKQIPTYRPNAIANFSSLKNWHKPAKKSGCFHFPDPALSLWSWARMPYGDGCCSLLGIVHTLSSRTIQKQIGDYLCSPLREWDALICTSSASQIVVKKFLERQESWLQQKLGAANIELPDLPVIPLGITSKDWQPSPTKQEAQKKARYHLNLNQNSLIVLMTGRLDLLTKYNPESALRCLNNIKINSSKNLEVIIYGEAPNEDMLRRWQEGALQVAPNLPIHWIPGRNVDQSRLVRWAADIFLSLSDNFQETFGITPLEAMASELPCIVTDWNGYCDTVLTASESREPTGFRIRTTFVEGLGNEEACALITDSMDYSIALGRMAQGIAFDVEELEACILKLAHSESLRLWMGGNGLKRAKTIYNWKTIIKTWEDLSKKLDERRYRAIADQRDLAAQMPHWMPNYSDSFGSFATSIISKEWQPDLPCIEEQKSAINNPFNDWDKEILNNQGSARHLGWCIKKGLISIPKIS